MFQELLIAFASSALVLSAVAWLTRSIILHFLSKDFETFKQQLTHQSALELENLRHSLRLVATEREKQIGLLQEKRAAAIVEIYARLVAFIAAAESFAAIVEFGGEPSKPDKAKTLNEKGWEFRDYFLKHRIYFSQPICEKVDQLFNSVMTKSGRFQMWHAMSEKHERLEGKMHEAWDAAAATIKEKAPPLLAEIEREFRTLLGVIRE